MIIDASDFFACQRFMRQCVEQEIRKIPKRFAKEYSEVLLDKENMQLHFDKISEMLKRLMAPYDDKPTYGDILKCLQATQEQDHLFQIYIADLVQKYPFLTFVRFLPWHNKYMTKRIVSMVFGIHSYMQRRIYEYCRANDVKPSGVEMYIGEYIRDRLSCMRDIDIYSSDALPELHTVYTEQNVKCLFKFICFTGIINYLDWVVKQKMETR